MNREELPQEASREDKMRDALKHYEELATKACWHRSDIPDAIRAYYASLPPAEGAEKSCLSCRFHNSPTYHDKMWCRDCQQLSHYEQQPTAEGAEEILDAKEIYLDLCFKNIQFEDRLKLVVMAMEKYATLHAQRIAEKMVEERLMEELIGYDKFLSNTYWGISHIIKRDEAVDEYLKSRER